MPEETKSSPKKKNKKKAKAAPEVHVAKEVVVTPTDVIVDVTPEVTSDVTSVEEKDPIQEALEAAAADDDTIEKSMVKSPKKNKKSKESRNKYQVGLV